MGVGLTVGGCLSGAEQGTPPTPDSPSGPVVSGGTALAEVFRTSPSSEHAAGDGYVPLEWVAKQDFRILRVNALDSTGAGSQRWALNVEEPRIVVFDVGGYPDLESTERTLRVPTETGALAGWLTQHTRAVELDDAEPPNKRA